MKMLDTILSSYIANEAYRVWIHRKPYMNGRLQNRFDVDRESYLFEVGKFELEREMQELSRLGLVNRHLFPNYDQYEEIVEDFVEREIFVKGIHIPNCDAFPNGLYFQRNDLVLPAKMFQKIAGTFVWKMDYKLTLFVTSAPSAFFWHNLDLGYDRMRTMASWNGTTLDIKGEGSLVVSQNLRRGYNSQLVPFILSVLVSAYQDYRELCQRPKDFRYVQTTLRKRQRSVRYLEEILCSASAQGSAGLPAGVLAKRSLGRLIKLVAEVEQATAHPKQFTEIRHQIPTYADTIDAYVESVASILKETEGYRLMQELQSVLQETDSLLPDASPHVMCDLWNRCVKQQVSSIEQLKAFILSKCQAVMAKGSALLAQRLLYEDMMAPGLYLYEEARPIRLTQPRQPNQPAQPAYEDFLI